MPDLDWEALVYQLAEALQPQATTRTYQGAPYTSRDSGTYRYRSGELEPNVGLLDPVDLLAGTLTPAARQAVKVLARQLRREVTAPRALAPEAEGLLGQIDTILDDVRRGMPSEVDPARVAPSSPGPAPFEIVGSFPSPRSPGESFGKSLWLRRGQGTPVDEEQILADLLKDLRLAREEQKPLPPEILNMIYSMPDYQPEFGRHAPYMAYEQYVGDLLDWYLKTFGQGGISRPAPRP